MASWAEAVTAITSAGTTSGLSQDQINAAVAVAKSEAGYTGVAGDNGTSFGLFQFHLGGQLNGFAAWLGKAISDAGQTARTALGLDAQYALRPGGYLYNALIQGTAKGYSGPDLAYYASQYGQVSAFPQRAADAFVSLFGGKQTQPPDTSKVPTGAAPPDPTKITGTPANKDPLTQLADAAAAIAAFPSVVAAGINDAVGLAHWLGQPNIILRLTLGIIGVLLILVGLGLFGFSFVPRQITQDATTALKSVAAV